jgi:hypothetical protein
MSPAQAMALHVGGSPLPPMAMVTVDGGGGYWNPHPGDNPMAMVVDELVPMCQQLGLGLPPHHIGTMGISMGGYGALLLVRVASGDDDPFHPGVVALAHALPPGAIVEFSSGCHTGPFFVAQEPPSLAFLAQHLV